MKNTLVFYNKKKLIDALILPSDIVLDVGFWGQGKKMESEDWPHRLLKNKAKDIYGIDLEIDYEKIPADEKVKYFISAAEDFNLNMKFDIVFAGDLIEHVINPGLFLDNAKKHLNENGRLILTTPNTFNLFLLAGKITRPEPPINPDHTFYFNRKTLGVLLDKCGWEVERFGFMYTLDYDLKESFKKKFLNIIYKACSFFTPKYYETLVVVAKIKK